MLNEILLFTQLSFSRPRANDNLPYKPEREEVSKPYLAPIERREELEIEDNFRMSGGYNNKNGETWSYVPRRIHSRVSSNRVMDKRRPGYRNKAA